MRGVERTRGEDSLRREVGTLAAALVAVNATLGTGIFKIPSAVAAAVASPGVLFGVWLAGGMIALAGALSFAELAVAMPRSGGLYEYLRRSFGETVAFVFGWSALALLIPAAVGSFARLAAESTVALLGLAPDPRRDGWLALAAVAACVLPNLLDVRTSARAQGVVTLVKYAGVALLATLGLAWPAAHAARAVQMATAGSSAVQTIASLPAAGASGILGALVPVMWAYDGWSNLASLAGEARAPARTLPRAFLLGTVAITALYLVANGSYLHALGLSGLRAANRSGTMPALLLAEGLLGTAGRRLLAALVLLASLGACMGSLLTDARVFVPLAADGLFPRALGVVSPAGVPARAVVVCGLLGSVYVLFRSFEELTSAFVIGYFLFYALAVIGLVRLRRRAPELSRDYRVPGYPIVPIAFLTGSLALLAGALLHADRTAIEALAVMVLGLPLSRLSPALRARRRARAASEAGPR